MVSRKFAISFSVITLLASCIPTWGYVTPVRVNPADYGLPVRMRELPDFQKLDDEQHKTLTSAVRTKIVLSWLIEERKSPSPTTKGIGGGDISSGYIQAQMMKYLGYSGNPIILKAVSDNIEVDPAIRDAAGIWLDSMSLSSNQALLRSYYSTTINSLHGIITRNPAFATSRPGGIDREAIP